MNVNTFFLLSLKLPSSQAVLRYRTAIATFKKAQEFILGFFCFGRAKRTIILGELDKNLIFAYR